MSTTDRADDGGGGAGRPLPDWPQEGFLVRYEEEPEPRTRWRVLGFLHARKRVRVERIGERLPANAETLIEERLPVAEGDAGGIETLADGSVSIPLYEEQLVVTKRIVLRERVIIRKQTVMRQQRLRAEMKREEIEIEADENVVVQREQ